MTSVTHRDRGQFTTGVNLAFTASVLSPVYQINQEIFLLLNVIPFKPNKCSCWPLSQKQVLDDVLLFALDGRIGEHHFMNSTRDPPWLETQERRLDSRHQFHVLTPTFDLDKIFINKLELSVTKLFSVCKQYEKVKYFKHCKIYEKITNKLSAG